LDEKKLFKNLVKLYAVMKSLKKLLNTQNLKDFNHNILKYFSLF